MTVTEVAAALRVSTQRVRAMIKAGRLPAQKVGPIWIIRERDLALVADRKPGRPPKQEQT